ncbi:MAG: hypothetical protein ABJH68_19850 [Ilumatobacter sp.]|uniref:hypothetical protein n=1 Tax=Ilumatobacter sp. TaxID=1967498 RepID=UPI003296E87F
MTPSAARTELVTLLQMAYSGERAAAYAYLGHRRSLWRAKRGADRAMLAGVLVDEIRHRRIVRRMLRLLDAGADERRERRMRRIGLTIAAFCRVGGWYAPMYGAGRLERGNIVEYEVAARLAHLAGHDELVDELLELAEVEWDHEHLFRTAASTHPLWRLSPKWPETTPRATIRSAFDEFLAGREPEPALRWNPLR